LSRRIIDLNKAQNLKDGLCSIHKKKLEAANNALHSAQAASQLKKALQVKSMIIMYGISGYLQLLDDEPAPFESRDELLMKAREGLLQAAEKRTKLKEELIAKHTVMQHDHKCSTSNDSEKLQPTENANSTVTYNELVRDLCANYNHACLNSVAIEKLEKDTRCQVSSDLWHQEHKLCITASICN